MLHKREQTDQEAVRCRSIRAAIRHQPGLGIRIGILRFWRCPRSPLSPLSVAMEAVGARTWGSLRLGDGGLTSGVSVVSRTSCGLGAQGRGRIMSRGWVVLVVELPKETRYGKDEISIPISGECLCQHRRGPPKFEQASVA